MIRLGHSLPILNLILLLLLSLPTPALKITPGSSFASSSRNDDDRAYVNGIRVGGDLDAREGSSLSLSRLTWLECLFFSQVRLLTLMQSGAFLLLLSFR